MRVIVRRMASVSDKGKLFTGGESYAKYRPTYPNVLFDKLYSLVEPSSWELAVDIGCGTGQVTTVIAEKFQKVIGLDSSESQIKAAIPHKNVEYALANAANTIPVGDNSVDLITIAQAVRFFFCY